MTTFVEYRVTNYSGTRRVAEYVFTDQNDALSMMGLWTNDQKSMDGVNDRHSIIERREVSGWSFWTPHVPGCRADDGFACLCKVREETS